MFEWVRSLFSRPAPASTVARSEYARLQAKVQGLIRSRYESAMTTQENIGLWPLADYLSAKASNDYSTRRTLKIRARSEAANNSYFRGMIDTMADDIIGRGPRLQSRWGRPEWDRPLEKRFHEWSAVIDLGDDLRTIAKGKIGDGEGFALNVTNAALRRTFGGQWTELADAVQLDLYVAESDQCTTPTPGFVDYYWVDGMILDRMGRPTEYHFLRTHPGDLFFPQMNPLAFDKWKPDDVTHWFRRNRPGQVRGVPEITPALELFAKLRRYTKAVLDAAELAADFAAVLESDAPADTGEPVIIDDGAGNQAAPLPIPFEAVQIDRGMQVVLPGGQKMHQFEAKQPTQTYEMFVRVLIREIARCLDIPLSIALGDASDSNYSSARMEHLRYHRRIGVDRATLETHGLEKIFSAWYAEARLVGLTTPGYLPRDLPPVLPPHRWLWPRTHSIDPVKDATADQIELKNGTTTLAAIYASRGEDWEEALEQQGREAEKRKELGLVLTPAKELDKAMAAAARALVRRENRRKRVHLNGSANGSR